MSLVGDIRSVARFLSTLRRSGGDVASCATRQVDSLLEKVRSSTLSFEDATQAIEAFATGPWSSEDRARFHRAVEQQIVSPRMAPCSTICGGAGNRTQKMECLDLYCTPNMVTMLRGTGGASSSKLEVVAQFVVHLGLRWPCENTKAKLVAFLFAIAVGPVNAIDMDMVDKYEVLKALKTKIKEWNTRIQPYKAPLWVYPASAAELKEVRADIYDAVYAQEAPVQSSSLMLDEFQWARLVESIPRRCTRKRGSSLARSSSLEELVKKQMQMFMDMSRDGFPRSRSPRVRVLDNVTESAGPSLAGPLALPAPPPLAKESPATIAATTTPPQHESKEEIASAHVPANSAASNDKMSIDDVASRIRGALDQRAARKKPAAAPRDSTPPHSLERPAPSKNGKPTHYLGGVIYVDKRRGSYRVYKTLGDKIEAMNVKCTIENWNRACELLEG